MAFSTEHGRKTTYSDDVHKRIVWQQIAQEKPHQDIAKFFHTLVGTAHIWQKFEATEGISKEVSRERKRQGVLDDLP